MQWSPFSLGNSEVWKAESEFAEVALLCFVLFLFFISPSHGYYCLVYSFVCFLLLFLFISTEDLIVTPLTFLCPFFLHCYCSSSMRTLAPLWRSLSLSHYIFLHLKLSYTCGAWQGGCLFSFWFMHYALLRNVITHSLCIVCIWILWWSRTLCS